MPAAILGLDIGGANLKAATADKRAAAVPFPLWKQPEKLTAALTELVARFPDADELAVTMTGELCDCYPTKREGVAAILNAALGAARGRPVWVWGTDGRWRHTEDAKRDYLTVAAANWHALATFAGRFAVDHGGLLVDVGTTTTDVIPLDSGVPVATGSTDPERLALDELVYTGIRRTPVFALLPRRTTTELFATTLDVYLVLGLLPENPFDSDTADGRPATVEAAFARLARVRAGDTETESEETLIRLAVAAHDAQRELIAGAIRNVLHGPIGRPELRTVVVSGGGEFLALKAVAAALPDFPATGLVSLTERLGPDLSAVAPAYAVATLLAERRT